MSKDNRGRSFAFGRIASIGAAVIISAALTWKFADRLNNEPDVLGIIATIFSILAAALIAIISILGDPSMLIDHSWRYNTLAAAETQRKLHRKTDIFVLYIVILGLLFAFLLTPAYCDAYAWMQKIVFLFVVLGFLASLTLPQSLKEIQRKRLNDAIAQKKGPSS
ncbi:MAG TPA: hypothetical protein VJS47_02640 [Rhizomicrobium sp.]|nr:hypothetical protein [Rhizomicrobium sp.]